MELIGILLVDTNNQKNMATKYNWVIGQVESKPENGFITKVDYTVFASNGIQNASITDSINYEPREEGEFKPLQEITLEDMIKWVQESVGKDSVETSLASQIEAQPNPILTSHIPWKV
jgi:hypothetical protein